MTCLERMVTIIFWDEKFQMKELKVVNDFLLGRL